MGAQEISARGGDTRARSCGEVACDRCLRRTGRDGLLSRLPTKPYCRSRGQEARGLLRITALTQRGCKRTYTSSRNDLTTQGYPIEGDAVD